MKERTAVKRRDEIVCACPINAVCTSKIEGSKDWRRCGHYDGLIKDNRGLRIVCRME